MKKLCQLLNIDNEELLFEYLTSSFKNYGIIQWDYFVNWDKALNNLKFVEKELNLLNVLIGKEDVKQELYLLLKEYPQVLKAFPYLIAYRLNKIYILTDTENFIYKEFNFKVRPLSDAECLDYADFFVKCGLGILISDKKIKNLADYVTGVEVGLDSNGRKNRGGQLMERLVETFVKKTCTELNLEYLCQANAAKIKRRWNIDVMIEKSSRSLDFVINKHGKLFFIECNFYGGGGSKLKSTANEYVRMNKYWNNQDIEFIWITDGAGWVGTLKPLREYYDSAEYLLNLEMLKQNILTKIVNE